MVNDFVGTTNKDKQHKIIKLSVFKLLQRKFIAQYQVQSASEMENVSVEVENLDHNFAINNIVYEIQSVKKIYENTF